MIDILFISIALILTQPLTVPPEIKSDIGTVAVSGNLEVNGGIDISLVVLFESDSTLCEVVNPFLDDRFHVPATIEVYDDNMTRVVELGKSNRPTVLSYEISNLGLHQAASMTADYVNLADKSMADFEGRNRRVSFDDGYIFTAPVKAKKSSQNGLYFMGGNVEELCKSMPELFEIKALTEQKHVVRRGGAWASSIDAAGCGFRILGLQTNTFNTDGLRLICEFD